MQNAIALGKLITYMYVEEWQESVTTPQNAYQIDFLAMHIDKSM